MHPQNASDEIFYDAVMNPRVGRIRFSNYGKGKFKLVDKLNFKR